MHEVIKSNTRPRSSSLDTRLYLRARDRKFSLHTLFGSCTERGNHAWNCMLPVKWGGRLDTVDLFISMSHGKYKSL